MKKNQGITLIALVITIIILIILTGISISIIMGKNGLVDKVRQGATNYMNAAEEEQDAINNLIAKTQTEESGNNKKTKNQSSQPIDPNVTLQEAQSDDMLTKTINSKYTDSTYTKTNKIVTIPAGYKITTDASKIEDGIVIEDVKGNQFVWIPVEGEIADKITENELGGTGKSGVTTSLKSKSGIISGIERTNIGVTSGKREPDILTNYDKQENASTYLKDAGFTNTDTAFLDFATDLSESYKNMIESVAEYGGFYVGRYEITGTLDNPTEISGYAITGGTGSTGEQEANWYKLYNACTKFSTESATSRMIWGCQWDEICKFIGEKGYNNSNSGTFGNYKDNVVKASNGIDELTTIDKGTKLKTGITTFTKTCNIYDLAGNCAEFTQEAVNTSSRAIRGGAYSNDSTGYYVSNSNSYNTITATKVGYSSRPILYINK